MAAAAVPIVGSLIGGYFQNKAAKDATKAQTQSNQQAIDYSKYMFDTMRGDEQPFMQAGQQGLAALAGGYQASPFYAYQKKEMLDGLNASHAALGSLYSGGTDIDRMRHINGLAAADQAQWFGQQMGLAGLGQNAASQTGVAGMNNANNVGGYLQNQGIAQANGAISQGNNWANTIGQIGAGLGGLMGQSSYGAPTQATNYGIPAPVSPYASTNYGTSGSWFG
jgi:hypothetical protein